ncbi:hypothetical protein [Nocardia sp. CC227C]|uniref:hypothetical protein n=1 Tax=Nocardia sp. CC227C TaxID=3044562 RepID=UPI00278C4D2D|nr:hypothetical protein [Nocardia sp. CC227C]
MSIVHRALRAASYAVASLPVAFTSVDRRVRLTRWAFGSTIDIRASGARARTHTVLAAVLGLLACFVALPATVTTVRGFAYPLVTGGEYGDAWGGPTLAGAWAVHAVVGIALLPAWVVLLAGIGSVQRHLAARLLGRDGPWWPIPVAVLVAAVEAVYLLALWQA